MSVFPSGGTNTMRKSGAVHNHRRLVPTFRSLCAIAASTVTNFGKSWALPNLLTLVPLYRSEVPDRPRRLRCRDFRPAALTTLALIASGILIVTTRAASAAPCAFDAQGEGRVVSAIDAHSFRLEDGHEVRLAGIAPAFSGKPLSGKPG